MSNNNVLWIIGAIALILIVGPQLGLFSTIGGLENVLKADWGHICCIQNDDYDVNVIKYIDDVTNFPCDSYTNECIYQFKVGTDIPWYILSVPGTFPVYYQVCNLDGTGCSITQSKVVYGRKAGSVSDSFIIPVGKSIKIVNDCYTWESSCKEEQYKYIQLEKKCKTFYIEGEENGQIFTQESCVLSSKLKGLVLSSGLNELSKVGANKCQNYMVDFVSTMTPTYTYNLQKVICQARTLYKIDSQKFMDGSTKLIQGNSLGLVGCCPTEANCDSTTFTFKPDVIKECTYSTECANGGKPVAIDATHYVTYNCISGQCVKSAPKVTECTTTAQCILKYGANSVCDLSPGNWGKCKTNTPPNYCGDGTCDGTTGENVLTCCTDCGINCGECQNIGERCGFEKGLLGITNDFGTCCATSECNLQGTLFKKETYGTCVAKNQTLQWIKDNLIIFIVVAGIAAMFIFGRKK